MIDGLTIVQAEKYNGVIGVSHIRELLGAMDEKRAAGNPRQPVLVREGKLDNGVGERTSRAY
jgi:hypothetical protein